MKKGDCGMGRPFYLSGGFSFDVIPKREVLAQEQQKL
jgi:hypothetical protein